jgi:hypothetical protein
MSEDDDYYLSVYIKRVPTSGTISFVYSTLIRIDSIIHLTIVVGYSKKKRDCTIYSDPLYYSIELTAESNQSKK